MLIIGYTHRLQFELHPDFVLSNTACETEAKTKNTFSTHDKKIMYNTFISKILK